MKEFHLMCTSIALSAWVVFHLHFYFYANWYSPMHYMKTSKKMETDSARKIVNLIKCFQMQRVHFKHVLIPFIFTNKSNIFTIKSNIIAQMHQRNSWHNSFVIDSMIQKERVSRQVVMGVQMPSKRLPRRQGMKPVCSPYLTSEVWKTLV